MRVEGNRLIVSNTDELASRPSYQIQMIWPLVVDVKREESRENSTSYKQTTSGKYRQINKRFYESWSYIYRLKIYNLWINVQQTNYQNARACLAWLLKGLRMCNVTRRLAIGNVVK
jgi:hypothetical protein